MKFSLVVALGLSSLAEAKRCPKHEWKKRSNVVCTNRRRLHTTCVQNDCPAGSVSSVATCNCDDSDSPEWRKHCSWDNSAGPSCVQMQMDFVEPEVEEEEVEEVEETRSLGDYEYVEYDQSNDGAYRTIDNPCLNHKCKNEGICVPDRTLLKKYRCVCPHPWQGFFCLQRITDMGDDYADVEEEDRSQYAPPPSNYQPPAYQPPAYQPPAYQPPAYQPPANPGSYYANNYGTQGAYPPANPYPNIYPTYYPTTTTTQPTVSTTCSSLEDPPLGLEYFREITDAEYGWECEADPITDGIKCTFICPPGTYQSGTTPDKMCFCNDKTGCEMVPPNTDVGCKDINECAHDDANLCDENANCFNHQGTYQCQCKEGYESSNDPSIVEGTEGDCVRKCECQNGGTCIGDGSEPYTCDCSSSPGYTGEFCERVQCATVDAYAYVDQFTFLRSLHDKDYLCLQISKDFESKFHEFIIEAVQPNINPDTLCQSDPGEDPVPEMYFFYGIQEFDTRDIDDVLKYAIGNNCLGTFEGQQFQRRKRRATGELILDRVIASEITILLKPSDEMRVNNDDVVVTFHYDLNECASGDDTCHVTAECANNDGSYSCTCPADTTDLDTTDASTSGRQCLDTATKNTLDALNAEIVTCNAAIATAESTIGPQIQLLHDEDQRINDLYTNTYEPLYDAVPGLLQAQLDRMNEPSPAENYLAQAQQMAADLVTVASDLAAETAQRQSTDLLLSTQISTFEESIQDLIDDVNEALADAQVAVQANFDAKKADIQADLVQLQADKTTFTDSLTAQEAAWDAIYAARRAEYNQFVIDTDARIAAGDAIVLAGKSSLNNLVSTITGNVATNANKRAGFTAVQTQDHIFGSARLEFDTTTANIDNGFDVSNSRFTVSVAGYYFFTWTIHAKDSTDNVYIQLMHNFGLVSGDIFIMDTDRVGDDSFTQQAIIECAVGDTVFLTHHMGTTTDGTTFTGFLIGPAYDTL